MYLAEVCFNLGHLRDQTPATRRSEASMQLERKICEGGREGEGGRGREGGRERERARTETHNRMGQEQNPAIWLVKRTVDNAFHSQLTKFQIPDH